MATVGSGKYTYEVIEDWARLPDEITFSNVSAVATDSQDRVYAFHRADPPVVVFDRDGNYLSSWGSGRYENPHGIYIADDIVYLTDREGSIAQKCTLDGTPLLTIGTPGVFSDTGCEVAGEVCPRSAGPFNYLTELVPSPSGDLYVSDGYRNARVHRFSAAGELISSWGEPGKGGPNPVPPAPQPHSGTGRPHLPVRSREQPGAGILPGWRVHHHVDRYATPSGHLPGQRGHFLYQRTT